MLPSAAGFGGGWAFVLLSQVDRPAVAGLDGLVTGRVVLPGDAGANPAAKVASIVAGMIAGADSIDDLNMIRHGGMGSLFAGVYAPSTLGSFLRAFTFGHVRQVQSSGTRLLVNLVGVVPEMLPAEKTNNTVFVDVDSVLRRVYGKAKQGAAFGHTKVGGYGVRLRGLNPLIATICGSGMPPVVAATRIRAGNAASARGAANLVADAVRTAFECVPDPDTTGTDTMVILRGDSAFYSAAVIWAAKRNGARFSITVKQDAKVRAAIAQIEEQAWTPIKYPRAVWDEDEQRWISDAEIAEIGYTAFAHTKRAVTARLIVRRVRRLDPHAAPGPGELFASWRYHAVFSDSPYPLMQAESEHRGRAIIEQTLADLINGPLAHLPSGKINANGAWLAMAGIAHNLLRAAAALTGRGHRDRPGNRLGKGARSHHPHPPNQRRRPRHTTCPNDHPTAARTLAMAGRVVHAAHQHASRTRIAACTHTSRRPGGSLRAISDTQQHNQR